jgi:deoxyribodipyrimidine photolyase
VSIVQGQFSVARAKPMYDSQLFHRCIPSALLNTVSVRNPSVDRHIAAGFLIEYLNIDWRHGELWFHDTLIDADVPIQAMMWQNGGHSGMDQWNFVMHPVFAAKACDPDGDYVRQWLPQVG